MVAQRFSNWSKSAPPYFISYDDEPPPGSDLPFVDYWVKGALEGLQVPFGDFSFGTACARLGRVPTEHGESLAPRPPIMAIISTPVAYTELLRQSALRSGVELAGHAIASVKIDGDRIASVQTGDGRSIAADLFIDASGSERILIGGLPGAEFEFVAAMVPMRPLDRMQRPAPEQPSGIQPIVGIPCRMGGTVPFAGSHCGCCRL